MTEVNSTPAADATAPVPAWRPYTRTGDDGDTTLGDHTRDKKTNLRIVAYGACDEVSAFIGYTVNTGTDLTHSMVRALTRVQNDLVDVAADVCAPIEGDDSAHLRIHDGYIARLERACDHFNESLSHPTGFVVPGGTATAALLHYTYSITRRAERSAVDVREHDRQRTNPLATTYLNRLANLLLVLARVANEEHGDTPWDPGLSDELSHLELWEPDESNVIE